MRRCCVSLAGAVPWLVHFHAQWMAAVGAAGASQPPTGAPALQQAAPLTQQARVGYLNPAAAQLAAADALDLLDVDILQSDFVPQLEEVRVGLKVRWHAELTEQGRSWRRTSEERACLRGRRPLCQGQFRLLPPIHHPSPLLTTAPCTRSN